MPKRMELHGFFMREIVPVLAVTAIGATLFLLVMSLSREPAWQQHSYPGYSLSEMLFRSPVARDMMQ